MPSSPATPSIPTMRRIYYMAFVIVLSIGLAGMAILNFAQMQYQAAVNEWESRLNVIADSRANDVQSWLKRHYGELALLANNHSLQRYTAELQQKPQDAPLPVQTAEGEVLDTTARSRDNLRDLLTLTAERGGFAPVQNESQGPLSLQPAGSGGIAVLDMEGRVLAATAYMPPIAGQLADFVHKAPVGQQRLYDFQARPDGSLETGFLIPIYAMQGDLAPSAQIGMILGIKKVGPDFFALLQQPGATERTLEALLVRLNPPVIEYINPLRNNPAPLSFRLQEMNTPLAESFSLLNPGRFGQLRDYANNTVLFTSRTIGGTPWVLVQKIDRSEALAKALETRNHMITSLSFALLAAIAAIIAAWRHGVSRNAVRLSRNLTRTIRDIRLREEVLKLVTNNHPGAIFLLDEANHVQYANEEAVERSGIEEKDLINKQLGSLLGTAEAEPYLHAGELALESDSIVSWTRRETDADGDVSVFRTNHIPVDDIGFEAEPARGVLVIEEDITQVVREKERRERTQHQLTNSLVKMMDMRDPFAANHSTKVSAIARAIAQELGLDAVQVEAIRTAGKLMNIGKMSVPQKVLTKTAGLDIEEKKVIQDSLLASADMLTDVEFEGPVVAILRQSLEHFDGTGPGGLKGEEILLGARIIAVANAFVGMTNPRAYRKALSFEQAQDVLMKQTDLDYDRRVIAALIHFTESRGGREVLERIGTPKSSPTQGETAGASRKKPAAAVQKTLKRGKPGK